MRERTWPRLVCKMKEVASSRVLAAAFEPAFDRSAGMDTGHHDGMANFDVTLPANFGSLS